MKNITLFFFEMSIKTKDIDGSITIVHADQNVCTVYKFLTKHLSLGQLTIIDRRNY